MYKYELHCHTSESSRCGQTSASDMADFYKKAGYTGLVITDHFLNGNTTVPKDLPWEETRPSKVFPLWRMPSGSFRFRFSTAIFSFLLFNICYVMQLYQKKQKAYNYIYYIIYKEKRRGFFKESIKSG